ncbi:MAG: MBOAT family protein [Oscillospiraceae bacterium]|jgi:alginate O-acetyltransferase complex protein AlgI|nr:MBOAT family protein [Oscillospiraceae bacterium]
MLFNSYIFIFVLLPVSLAGYFLLNRAKFSRPAMAWLCLMSLVFYGWVTPLYLPVICVSIAANYALASAMTLTKHKKAAFAAALAVNLGVLFFYKYYDFFIGNVNRVLKTDLVLLRLLLPLGISFFTFQQLSYVIDVYKGSAPRYKFLDYAAFILFFPQLVAGPICLHSEIIPQFEDAKLKRFNFANFAPGLLAFALGLAKKTLIADQLGAIANLGFAAPDALNTAGALVSMFCYTLQIYFDFSGYSDMATGISLMFNIRQPQNFDSPYRSLTILEFWKRWHMTLTRFFTAYVYFPLGGSRKGTLRTYLNVMAVFVISGFWHGAGWTFILWGFLHGIFSVVTRIFRKTFEERIHPAFNWLLTFGFVNAAWVLFRSESLQSALTFFRRLSALDFAGGIPDALTDVGVFAGQPQIVVLIAIALCVFASVQLKNTNERLANFRPKVSAAISAVILLVLSVLSISGGVSTFLYWNF